NESQQRRCRNTRAHNWQYNPEECPPLWKAVDHARVLEVLGNVFEITPHNPNYHWHRDQLIYPYKPNVCVIEANFLENEVDRDDHQQLGAKAEAQEGKGDVFLAFEIVACKRIG